MAIEFPLVVEGSEGFATREDLLTVVQTVNKNTGDIAKLETNVTHLLGKAGEFDALSAAFTVHRTSDRAKWQDTYQTKLTLYDEIAEGKGLMRDVTAVQDIIGSQASARFMVPGEYGGMLTMVAVNVNAVVDPDTGQVVTPGNYAEVFVNGASDPVWSSFDFAGTDPGDTPRPVINYAVIDSGSTVYHTGLSMFTFTPYEPDPNSPPAKMVDQFNEALAQMYINVLIEARKIYEGTTPNLDYTQETVVLGDGGVLTVGGSGQWTAPVNGAIIVTYSAVAGAAKTVYIDGVEVWAAVLALLGGSTTKSPSDPIQINAGQVVTVGGLLGLIESLKVAFYPNA